MAEDQSPGGDATGAAQGPRSHARSVPKWAAASLLWMLVAFGTDLLPLGSASFLVLSGLIGLLPLIAFIYFREFQRDAVNDERTRRDFRFLHRSWGVRLIGIGLFLCVPTAIVTVIAVGTHRIGTTAAGILGSITELLFCVGILVAMVEALFSWPY